MDGGNNGEYTLIFNGENQPGTTSYLVEDLAQGQAYRFKVNALNYNGLGTESSEVTLYSCLPPSEIDIPVFSSSTETALTIQWSAPSETNGCPLTGYELNRDDGAGGAITTQVATFEPQELEGTITLTSSETSKTYRVQIIAYNAAGSVTSGIGSFVLADVPEKPAVPTYDSASTSDS